MTIRRPLVHLILIGLALIVLAACNRGSQVATRTPAGSVSTETATGMPAPSQTPIPPSQTPVPLAAIVNGEAITLDEYQAELARFKASQAITGTNLASDPEAGVLDELIDQRLLAQSAVKNGFTVDEAMLKDRIKSLEAELGGTEALDEWKTAHGYLDGSFQLALKKSIEAAWMRDQIIAAVAETADQVHVRQILLPTAAEANEVYAQLQSGDDFLDLAYTYDPATGGDLGWFPRGYLGEQAIDEAVFNLQPEQYSQVVETAVGYHIFYLVEKDANHPLQPDARRALQIKALQDWLSEQRAQSQIQVITP